MLVTVSPWCIISSLSPQTSGTMFTYHRMAQRLLMSRCYPSAVAFHTMCSAVHAPKQKDVRLVIWSLSTLVAGLGHYVS